MTVVLLAAGLTILIGLHSLWFMPARGWRRTIGPIAFAVLLSGQAVAYVGALGVARPAQWWLGGSFRDATIVSYVFDEPHNIFLWVQDSDGEPPLSLRFAWDRKLAETIYKLMTDKDNPGANLTFNYSDAASMFIAVHPKPPARNEIKPAAKG